MKKYIFSFVCLCCALLPALEGQAHEYPNHPELRKSDANIVGHILDKNTKEHLPYITAVSYTHLDVYKRQIFVPAHERYVVLVFL